ncbi:hypothetical protein [Ruminococcus flavefaciens]|uniref:hypothetical protein n=1 Tax=Ruminococcus flavefaciens TaxID=1265 RepID=UPI003F1255C8
MALTIILSANLYGDELLVEQGKTLDFPALEAELRKIKGIGDKRLEEIKAVVEKFLDIE